MKDFDNIYLTGDKHADFEQLLLQSIRYGITERDLLIILGDVGINYFGDYRDNMHKDLLALVPGTILCIRGNHEMRPTDIQLKGIYKETLWMGDKAYVESRYPRIIMAEDGARYHINERDYLVIGGAYSVDKPLRLERGYNWFPDEQLTESEMTKIRDKISSRGNKEDIILAHTCPYDSRPLECFMSGVDENGVDNTMERFLQEVVDKTEYKQFFCGHWHIDKQDVNNAKLRFLYEDIVMIAGKAYR